MILGSSDTERLINLGIWGSIGLLALITFVLIVRWARKRYRETNNMSNGEYFWDLHTLDQLHKQGDLDDEEYRVLRQKTIETVSRNLD